MTLEVFPFPTCFRATLLHKYKQCSFLDLMWIQNHSNYVFFGYVLVQDRPLHYSNEAEQTTFIRNVRMKSIKVNKKPQMMS